MTRRLLTILAATVLVVLVGPVRPAAASCAYAADDPALFQLAEVVFTGEIVADEQARFGRERWVTFRVDRVYKGTAYAEQRVVSDTRAEDTFTLSGPGLMLVQGRRDSGGSVRTDGCAGSRPGPAPAALGPGGAPQPGSSRQVDTRTRTVLLFSGGVVFIALAVVVNRRARRRQG